MRYRIVLYCTIQKVQYWGFQSSSSAGLLLVEDLQITLVASSARDGRGRRIPAPPPLDPSYRKYSTWRNCRDGDKTTTSIPDMFRPGNMDARHQALRARCYCTVQCSRTVRRRAATHPDHHRPWIVRRTRVLLDSEPALPLARSPRLWLLFSQLCSAWGWMCSDGTSSAWGPLLHPLMARATSEVKLFQAFSSFLRPCKDPSPGIGSSLVS